MAAVSHVEVMQHWCCEPQALHHSISGSASAGAPRARRLTWACTAQFVAVLPSSYGAVIALLALQVWNQQIVPPHDCQGASEALWGTPHIWYSLCKFCLRRWVAHASLQLTPKPCLQSKGIDFFAAHPGLSNTSLCESGLCRTTFFQECFVTLRLCHVDLQTVACRKAQPSSGSLSVTGAVGLPVSHR